MASRDHLTRTERCRAAFAGSPAASSSPLLENRQLRSEGAQSRVKATAAFAH